MKVVFLSNILTSHQIPFCDSMSQLVEEFYFFQFNPARESWIEKGQVVCRKDFRYLHFYHEERAFCEAKILEADVVLIGSVDLSVIQRRLSSGKAVFVYLERFYKKGIKLSNIIRVVGGTFLHHGRFQRYEPYLLCSGGYCSGDAAVFGNYQGRTLKWGYFPETKYVDLAQLMDGKKEGSIIWVGRFIDWKHPDDMLMAANRLKKQGYQFQLKFLGAGPMLAELQRRTEQLGLNQCVSFLGNVPNETVRREMEQASIFVTTSDYQEGWGCVVNEGMNSGCAVIASHAMGSVPFLIKHGINGMVYESGNVDGLSAMCEKLLQSPNLCRKLGTSAYETICTEWNAQAAAERLVRVFQKRLAGQSDVYEESGPCSIAEPIKQSTMYARMINECTE